MSNDQAINLLVFLLPFAVTAIVMLVIAFLQCVRHPAFTSREKIDYLLAILLFPFYGPISWFEAARGRRHRLADPRWRSRE